MAVITIARETATGGRELGRFLARKLDYQYVDKSLFQKIAEDLNVSERTLESFEERRRYHMSNTFARSFSKSHIERIVGYDKSVVYEEEYKTSLESILLGTAREDNVVIIGRAAYFFLKDMKNCFHSRLVAPMDWRKKYALENYKISPDRVQEFIEKKDDKRKWFRRSICGMVYDDPLWFHLTLNMSGISIEKAAELIMSVSNLSG
jgi:cytidylate kinase